MPGTNHQTESAFMDQLPIHLRDAAVDALRNYRLKQLIEMRKFGPDDFLKNHFQAVTTIQWMQIFEAVILTKISYFNVDMSFPLAYIDKLFEIIIFAFNEPDANIHTIYQKAQKDAPFFADWIKRTLAVRNTLIKRKKKSA